MPSGMEFARFRDIYRDALGRVRRLSGVFSLLLLLCPLHAQLVMGPATLPDATAGTYYNIELIYTTGTSPVTFALAPGSTLPQGLELYSPYSSAYRIRGTPTASGSYQFHIIGTDSSTPQRVEDHLYSLRVVPPGTALGFVTATLPAATRYAPYAPVPVVIGGTQPYHFNLGSSWPAGVGVDFNGSLVASSVTQAPGVITFTVVVTDSASPPATIQREFTLTVNPGLQVRSDILAGAAVGQAWTNQVSALGGAAPYTFAVTSGGLPPGLTLNSATGLISGTPTLGGEYTFRITATDSGGVWGYSEFSLFVSFPTFTVSPASWPPAYAGVPYSLTFTATGGTAPYVFTIERGEQAPPGLALSSQGVLTGTPTTGGNPSFHMRITDCAGNFNILSIGVDVYDIVPQTLPDATLNTAYSQQFFTQGFNYSSMALVSGALPAGVQFVSVPMSGSPPRISIQGTPTQSGSFTFRILASGPAGQQVSRTYTLRVSLPAPDPLTFQWSLPSSWVGEAYSGTIRATPSQYGPFVYSLTGGALPPGLALGAGNGAITGSPTAAGDYTFTVRAQGTTNSGTESFTISVFAAHLAMAPATIPAGRVNQPYSATFTPTGGTAPYYIYVDQAPPGLTWSLDNGSNPTAGTLSGQPTTAGTFTFRIAARDFRMNTGYRDYSVTVTGTTLTIQPSSLPAFHWGVPYSAQLAGAGGTPPYTFSSDCCWPVGVTLSSSGLISGTPSAAYQVNSVAVTVRDSASGAGQSTYAITYVPPEFMLLPMTLPDGKVATFYFDSITPSGATPPVQFAVSNGSLPPGLTGWVDASQFWIRGIATAAGSYPFRLTATDGAGRSMSLDYVVNIASQPFQVGPDSLPPMISGLPFAVEFAAAGGVAPYAFTASQSCPAALTLSASGAWSGVPGLSEGVVCTIYATDSRGVRASRDYLITVVPATLTVDQMSLPDGALRTAYSASIGAFGGTAPYTFALGRGALPTGLTLSAAGVLSGTPQQSGYFSIRITVRDAAGAGGYRDYELHIAGDVITVGPASLPDATLDQPYSAQLTASGGTPPYRFALVSGMWYGGLRLNADGSITGTPTGGSGGTNQFFASATDAHNSTGSSLLRLRVVAQGGSHEITVGPATLPDAIAGRSYSAQLTASGGTAPYRFSLVSGTLYDGLQLSAEGVISGIPLGAGGDSRYFIADATDSTGARGAATFQIRLVAQASVSLSWQSVSMPAAGDHGSVNVATASGAPWTADADAAWVTITGGSPGSGAGTVAFSVDANTGAARSGAIRIGDQELLITQESASAPGLGLVGSIAQVASAGGWGTSLTLVNLGGGASDARLSIAGDNGTAPWLPFTFPQRASAGTTMGATFSQTVGAGTSLVFDTTGPDASATAGSAQLRADGDVGGFAIFTYAPTGQAAVAPLETRNARSYLLAFDNTGAVRTGLAIANLDAIPANVNVVIRDDRGAQLGTGSIRLQAMGHKSFMLDDSIDGFPLTAGIRGTVEFGAGDGRISVLGLRANAITSGSDFALTSLPVLAGVDNRGGVLAQIASGAGWQTAVTLVNTGDAPAAANLDFFDDHGIALPLPLSYPQTGERETGSGVRRSIPAHGSLIIAVENSGDASLQGSAVLTTTGNVSGFAIFRYDPTGQEAVSPLQAVNAPAYVLAFDNTTSLSTGFAIANAASQPAAVNAILRNDAGMRIGAGVVNLPAHGHTSFMLTDTSSGGWAITAGIRGTIELETPAGGQIAPLGLRAASIPGRFTVTSIPLMSPR
jgi:large repetitive protein